MLIQRIGFADRGFSKQSSRESDIELSHSVSRMHSMFFSVACAFLIPFGALIYYKKNKADCASANTRQDWVQKSCVITGAAGDIGSTTARHFARKGADLLLVDLPSQSLRLKELQGQLRSLNPEGQVLVFEGDVTSPDDVRGYVDRAVKQFGKINFFFNNAGIQGDILPVQEQDDVGFLSLLRVNVLGVFLGLKYVSRAMIESGSAGVIINTASLAGILGPSEMSAYTASKFAVVGLTKSAAKDLAPYNIRVCAIAPGLLEGRLWDTQVSGRIRSHQKGTRGQYEISAEERRETERQLISATPMGRLGSLDEVASVVIFLCSEDASYITGVVLPIDGGRLQ